MKIEDEYSLRWGKYAGVPVSELPDDYLAMVHREASMTKKFTGAEIERRKENTNE